MRTTAPAATARDRSGRVPDASRAGVKTFILPRKNERDLLDIPEHLRRDVEFARLVADGDRGQLDFLAET